MSWIRTWHTYLGIFIAPTVLFFALTGTLQIFSLHESHGTYEPPVFLEKLASVHKDQVFAKKIHDEDLPSPAEPPEPEPATPLDTLLLKCFFGLVALGLTVSTLLGLWMGLTHIHRKRTGWWLLLAGITLPVGLLLI